MKDTFKCQFVMVTGGYGSSYLDSTEIFGDNVWRTVAAKLSVTRSKIATIYNRILCFGKGELKKI